MMFNLKKLALGCAAVAAVSLASASAEARQTEADFDLTMRATVTPKESSTGGTPTENRRIVMSALKGVIVAPPGQGTGGGSGVTISESKLTGAGFADAQGSTLTLELEELASEDGADTLSLVMDDVLTYKSKGKEYRGTGSVTVMLDGTEYTTTVDVRVKVRTKDSAEFTVITIKPKHTQTLAFTLSIKGKGIEVGTED